MAEESQPSKDLLAEITASIVGAYVANNPVPVAELPAVIASVASSIGKICQISPDAAPEPQKPAVPIKKSVTSDYLISLEDGKKYQTLKRHLGRLGLTPDQYRVKWGLPSNYPMTAPAYTERRVAIAKAMGLGRKIEAKPTARGKAKAKA